MIVAGFEFSLVVELSGISKSYGSVHALRNISLGVSEGETCVLIGPSGCGKSTLLRTVNGLVLPDTGTVRVDGETLNESNVQTIRHKIGYSIQDGGLFPHLSARENVVLLARDLGKPADSCRQRAEDLCELCRFPRHRLDALPGELSGGQQQRVSLMRALMLDPPILLLDEPLGALDPMIRAELQEELRQIIRNLGKTVLFVTHDLPEATHFADRIVLMRAGQIAQAGSFEELRNRPANDFVKQFVSAQESLTFRQKS